jgi:hypothetical protein
MNKTCRTHLFFFAAFLLVVASCQRKEPTSWDSEVLVPLASGRITIQDIVPDSIIYFDENNLWHLHINENLTDFDLDSIVRIPDTIISKRFEVPITGGPFTIPNGQQIIDVPEENLLNIRDVQLSEAIVSSGVLQYSIKSYINGYLTCNYEIPGVTLNGIGTLIQTTTQPSDGITPFVYSGSIDLSNHHFDLTGESGVAFNRIYSHLNIATAADAPTQAVIHGHDSIVVELKFLDPVIQYARGYFGEQDYSLDQSVDFSDNVNFPTGTLNLNAATMKLNIENNVGIDAQINFHALSSTNTATNETVNLQYAPLYQPINITRAFDNNGTVVPNSTEFLMNQNNSNIVPFIENLPNFILVNADIHLNPLGNVSDGNDFIYTANTIKAALDLDIPLNIGAENLLFTDTLDIGSSIEITADGHLYLYVNNSFPFSATCDAFIIDDQNQIVQVMLFGGVIQSALETGVEGETVAVKSIIDLPVNSNVIDNFKSENRILLRVRFDTPNVNEPSGLYSNYWMDFNITADGIVELKYR